jgi:hypothetical protein
MLLLEVIMKIKREWDEEFTHGVGCAAVPD